MCVGCRRSTPTGVSTLAARGRRSGLRGRGVRCATGRARVEGHRQVQRQPRVHARRACRVLLRHDRLQVQRDGHVVSVVEQ